MYHADGQKIAKKICLQITKEAKSIKSLLEECCGVGDVAITLAEALDPSSIGTKLNSFGGWASSVISGDQQEARSNTSLCRSGEELCMLKEDARSMVNYYQEVQEIVCSKLASLSAGTDPFSRGSTSLLHSLLAKINNLLQQAHLTLQTMTTLTSSSRESEVPCSYR